MNHGVRHTYIRYGCRCDLCRKACADYAKKRRDAARASPPANLKHGKASTVSNYGCTCEPCVKAWSEEMRRQRGARQGKEPPEHGLSGYKHYGCRCDVCLAAERSTRPLKQEEQKRRMADQQAETLAQAKRHGNEWTGPELEIASRKDLSARQVALMLGRSLSAVRNIRDRMRSGDPKLGRVLGPQP